ncbi:MAG TPA: VCBS repeat-containing protein [Polyangiaceae bacterium LLY-WYZ-15_(1-7)]|nr:hypothetical protein [Myxococcales bacterium]MAT23649.1 hypothetical protein [Sandaracinus sp.]HJL02151.1 VCBS repeat-containing protein [Polyangiaceae bacterium LLY-WYZ-15_(1-7)]HJL13353.1 VCBS repeat-containing protein [Polyangiaceae bacterium LLY-WYZ-15_(1-7)]
MSSARALSACALALLLAALPTPAAAQGADAPTAVEATAATLRAWTTEALEGARGPVSLTTEARWPAGSADPDALEARLVGAVREAVEQAGLERTEDAAAAATRLRLRLAVRGGHLDAELSTAVTPRHWLTALLGWGDTRAVRVRRPLDAPARRFVAALPALAPSTVVARTLALPGHGYLALAVVDLDGEGRAELVLLREASVEVLRLVADARGRPRLRLVERQAVPESPRPGVAARRPFGTLVAEDRGALARLRDQSAPFRIRWEGALRLTPADDPCPPGAHPLRDACAVPVDGRDYYASELVARVGQPTPPRAPTSFYARVHAPVLRRDGRREAVEVVVTPRGRLVARTGDRAVGLGGYGAAIGVADADQDGALELLASSERALGEGDALQVLRVREDGGLRSVWREEGLAGSVMVAGAGDLDGDGVPALLAIEERPDETAVLWVVR